MHRFIRVLLPNLVLFQRSAWEPEPPLAGVQTQAGIPDPRLRGSVRVVAAGASRLVSYSAAQLRLTDVTAWRALRQTLHYRHEGRRRQLRFRRDPQAYLADLEQRLIKLSLPS